MKTLDLVSHSPRQTQALGAFLGRLAKAGDVFLLVGALGAGKTCLAQGLARGLEVPENVTSPTFTLIREYRGRLPLYHVDCYRIDSVQETDELGLEDYLGGQGLCVVEWADKVMEVLPSERLLVHIDYAGDRDRRLRLEAQGTRYERLIDDVKRGRHLAAAES
ncbi:MAG: tRNA (adenosine(37)-N6)-threonylcarbamoyltransferase complex ATPase subunit type 1 TsaE [Dehalococcoidia bacterium]|nr:tRNA (adenosine(37)-N6)-threonylcarbamoyltransferase complex ATPase subunit type 1 TsaE [Dehalococcoidia bacterium]